MKRPTYWLRSLLVIGFLLIVGEYVTLTYIAPRYLIRKAQSVVSADLLIDEARLSALLTTTLSGLSLRTNTADAAMSAQQVVIRPRGLSISPKRVRVDTLEIEQPVLRFTWTKDGTMRWPALLDQLISHPPVSTGSSAKASAASVPWQTQIDSVKMTDGVVEFIDEKLPKPFHGVVDHLSFVLGPVMVPSGSARVSFAIRGRAVGFDGNSAPLYCSGWLDLTEKALEASCQLEPLALAAFQPYYVGPPEVRVYGTTLKSTSQWTAQSNNLTARIQLELGNLQEGDVSIRGRAIVDVKKLTKGQEPRLRGEVKLTGPLDEPSQWRAEFIAGDEGIQQLVGRLLEHGIRVLKVSCWGRKLGVGIGATDAELMRRFDEVGKEISEVLEILAIPSPEEVPAATPAAAPAPTVSPPPTPAEGTASPIITPATQEQPSAPLVAPVPTTPAPATPPVPAAPQPAGPPEPVASPGSSDKPADVTAPSSAPTPPVR